MRSGHHVRHLDSATNKSVPARQKEATCEYTDWTERSAARRERGGDRNGRAITALGCVFLLVDIQALDDGLPRSVRAETILHSLN
jgi:hypothetical protein